MSHPIRIDDDVAAVITARQETAALEGRRLSKSDAVAELLAEAAASEYSDDVDYSAVEPEPARCTSCGRQIATPDPDGTLTAADRWCPGCGGNAKLIVPDR